MSKNNVETEANDTVEEYSPALTGEIEEFIVTPYGTYGKTSERLLRVWSFPSQHLKMEKSIKVSFWMTWPAVLLSRLKMKRDAEIPSAVLVIGTLERRDGTNNVMQHIRSVLLRIWKL